MWKQKVFENCHTKNPKYLVILLHGYGANGQNLIELAEFFNKSLPDACYLAPNAIENWEGGFPDCYQWFSLSNGFVRRSLIEMSAHIRDANKKLGDFIDKKLQELNLTRKNLIIVGFSQGAMMASYQALISKEEIAGVIGFSGKLIMPELTGDKTLSKPKICLIHGQDDMVVEFSNFIEAKETLQKEGFDFETHALDNLEHTIDVRGIEIATNFINKITKS